MVKRYTDEWSETDRLRMREQQEGEYVLYTDHANEMRQVLEALRFWAGGRDTLIDKYRHYLDKGE